MLLYQSLISLALGAAVVHAAAFLTSPRRACDDLYKKYPRNVASPPLDLTRPSPANLNYTFTSTYYWNAGHGQLLPACIFYPTSAADVSFAVQVLNKYPDVPWAAKAGGHNTNKDWSSVANGVLISFRPFMQGTKLNTDGIADVQPGARWREAVGALKQYNKAVVGGRVGDVGVGGYTLGGGLSFLSSQYGFACDRVTEYEVVLADGTVDTVSQDQNTDLFYALKGGGGQFAIVTNFKMKTVDIGQVWGGIKVYSGHNAAAIINATHNFATRYPDTKAAIIPTFNTLLGSLTNVFVVFYFYDGPVVPAGVFDEFNAIKPLSDQTKVQAYADLLEANDSVNIYGFNYLIRAQTIPSLAGEDGKQLLKYQYTSFLEYAKKTQLLNLDLMVYSFAMQPLPTTIMQASLDSGASNAFNFDVADGDRIWMEYDISWINPLDEQNAYRYANHMTEDIVAYSRRTFPNAVSTRQTNKQDQYSPLFLNDAMFDQATSLLFKADTYQKLRETQQARDPKGFFSKRTGGAKFT